MPLEGLSRTMITNHVACGDRSRSMLASSFDPRRCSGSSVAHGRLSALPNSMHVRPAPWTTQSRILLFVISLVLLALPVTVSAAPSLVFIDKSGVHAGVIDGIHPRGQNDSSSQGSGGNSQNNNGSITMNVWLPILLVTLVFMLFSLCACIRRCATGGSAAATTANRGGSASANGNTGNQVRTRRRRRTPSQMSTKSLPPYMKEPGDHELVLFRGALETEDDQAPPHGMATLAESDEEGHAEIRNTTFDVHLDRVESIETMPDLVRRTSVSSPRPPELHHATMPGNHHRSTDAHSLDSIGSDAELLAAHQRGVSVDNHADPRGEAPSYTEAVSEMTTISLNDPQPNDSSSNSVAVPPSSATDPAAGRGRSRFSLLLHYPFGSRNDANDALHHQGGSALSRFSSRESHASHHSRTPSRNNNLSRTHTPSNSNLYRAFRSHSPGHAASSTISLDNISAPLTHTLTHAGFHAPKGGMTPEQIKLITSREALERFGVPYGPEAVAAFQLSRERLAEIGPPPDFESVTGAQQGQPGMTGNEDGAAEAVAGTTVERSADDMDPRLDTASSGSTSLSPHASPSHQGNVHAELQASIAVSYATARNTDEDHDRDGGPREAQVVEVHWSDDESEHDRVDDDDPHTARPMTPRTARPLSLSGRGAVVKRS